MTGAPMDLNILRNPELQRAIRENYVSFPAQAPVYNNQARADIQWRLAVLYFVHGLSINALARRYKLSRERAGQIIKAWRVLSVERGYIQEIPPDPAANAQPRVNHPALNHPVLNPEPAPIAVRGPYLS
jgi:hypothetical protein